MGQIMKDNSSVCPMPPTLVKSGNWFQKPLTVMMEKGTTGSWKSTSFFILAGVILIVQSIVNILTLGGLENRSYYGVWGNPFSILFVIFASIMFIGALFSRTGGLVWYKEVSPTSNDEYTKEKFNIAPFWGLFGGMTAIMLAIWSFQSPQSGYYAFGGWDLPPQILGVVGGLIGILAAAYISESDYKRKGD